MAKRRKSSQASQVIGDHLTELGMEELSLFLKLGPVLREWERVVDRYLEGDRKTLLEIGGRLAKGRGLSSADFRRQVICYEEAESGKREITAEEAPEESLRFHLRMEIQTGLAGVFGFRDHLNAKELETVLPSPLPTAFELRSWRPIADVLLSIGKLDETETKRFLSDSQWEACQDLLKTAREYEHTLQKAREGLAEMTDTEKKAFEKMTEDKRKALGFHKRLRFKADGTIDPPPLFVPLPMLVDR